MYLETYVTDDEPELGWVQFIAPIVGMGVDLIKKRKAAKAARKEEKKLDKQIAAEEAAIVAAEKAAAAAAATMPGQAGFGQMPGWVLPVGVGLVALLIVPKLLKGGR